MEWGVFGALDDRCERSVYYRRVSSAFGDGGCDCILGHLWRFGVWGG